MMKSLLAMTAALLLSGASAQAATTGLDLSKYRLTAVHALDTLNGLGLEASAIAYARDRGSLFVVGDEGLGVVELSLDGRTLGTMAFSGWPSRTTHHDAEGLAYLGDGQLVVAEERIQDAFRFQYVAGGSVDLSSAPWASIADYSYNNSGIEGLTVDPRDGRFFAVKQTSPLALLGGTLGFEADADGGVSTMAVLARSTSSAPTLFGVSSLSDVQSLGGVDALAGQAGGDHLLVLSLGAKRLVEIDRAGVVHSQLDLSSFTAHDIEGVTIDERGVIYLAAEDSGFGASQLLVLNPVPEPATTAMLLAGLALVGGVVARRQGMPR